MLHSCGRSVSSWTSTSGLASPTAARSASASKTSQTTASAPAARTSPARDSEREREGPRVADVVIVPNAPRPDLAEERAGVDQHPAPERNVPDGERHQRHSDEVPLSGCRLALQRLPPGGKPGRKLAGERC